jgi:aladin
LILPVEESILKKFTRVFFEDGLEGSLKVLEQSHSTFLSSISKGVLQFLNLGQRVNFFFNPHLKETGIESYEKNFSQTRQWKSAAIRCISWNTLCFKLAVAAVDDSIRIYTNEEQSIVLLLKNGLQKSITSMAWRPFSSSQLAVGCQNGFLVWTLDPNSCITRPLSQAGHFKHGNHFPVTSLEWNFNGSLLATASMKDSSILIWDVDKNSCVPLRRTSPPYLDLQWSMNGAYLFSSSVGNVFRVWNCETWKSDRWTIASGHVQSFQWSQCARFLLFVTSDDTTLYSLGFADELLFNESHHQVTPQQALPVADFSKICIDRTEVGGKAQQIAWNGKYLAVTFKDTNVVAIFQTTIRKHHLNVVPFCLVSGLGIEFPSVIIFQPSYKNINGADNILTIGWSTGRIEFRQFA